MKFSVKKPSSLLWSTNISPEVLEEKIASGSITHNWLVCPLGEASRAVEVAEFLANPAVFAPSPPEELVHVPIATTPHLPGYTVVEVRGIACGEAIMGTNIFRDIAAGLTDMVGGRSGAYETKVREGRHIALREMANEARLLGADAVVGVDIDYETVGSNGSMLMICASGTAVTITQERSVP